MSLKDEDIRRMAYEIWLAEGQPDGKDEEHWREAERRLAGPGKSAKAKAKPPAETPAKPDKAVSTRRAAKDAPATAPAEAPVKAKPAKRKSPA
jgi:hypothetical protein